MLLPIWETLCISNGISVFQDVYNFAQKIIRENVSKSCLLIDGPYVSPYFYKRITLMKKAICISVTKLSFMTLHHIESFLGEKVGEVILKVIPLHSKCFQLRMSDWAQCGKFRIFRSIRFYMKSILGILEVQNVPFWYN